MKSCCIDLEEQLKTSQSEASSAKAEVEKLNDVIETLDEKLQVLLLDIFKHINALRPN